MDSDEAVKKVPVVVELASDRLTASVRLRCSDRRAAVSQPADLTPQTVLDALEEQEIVIDDAAKEAVDEFLGWLAKAKGKAATEPFVVARGREPDDGRDEEFVWDESFQREAASWLDDAPVDFYTLNSILTIEKDTKIGTISPIVPPCDGVDVCGRPIPHHGSPRSLELDATLQRTSDDPAQIVSQVAGNVIQRGQNLTIEEVLLIPGDVGFDTGNVDSSVSVTIKGRVPDRFEVKSKGSITVGASIESANVAGDGDIVVCNGILGRHAGRVSANGRIVAKFASEANLVAKGDIKIGKQLMASRVCVGGDLIAAGASVIGGSLYADGGVEVASLGSVANIPTFVAVGVTTEVVQEAASIGREARRVRELVDQIRELVQPLQKPETPLNSDQEGQVFELISAADRAEARIAEDEERLQPLLENVYVEEAPAVLVSGMIHQGVVIRIGDRETVFHKDLKGPVSIEKRMLKNVTEIVAVNKITGSIKILTNERRSVDDLLDRFAMEEKT